MRFVHPFSITRSIFVFVEFIMWVVICSVLFYRRRKYPTKDRVINGKRKKIVSKINKFKLAIVFRFLYVFVAYFVSILPLNFVFMFCFFFASFLKSVAYNSIFHNVYFILNAFVENANCSLFPLNNNSITNAAIKIKP